MGVVVGVAHTHTHTHTQGYTSVTHTKYAQNLSLSELERTSWISRGQERAHNADKNSTQNPLTGSHSSLRCWALTYQSKPVVNGLWKESKNQTQIRRNRRCDTGKNNNSEWSLPQSRESIFILKCWNFISIKTNTNQSQTDRRTERQGAVPRSLTLISP